MNITFLQPFLIVLLITIVVFFLLREFNCWYWKINQRIKLMEDQNNLLSSLLMHISENLNDENSINKNEENLNSNDKSNDLNIVSSIRTMINKEKNKGIFEKSTIQEIIKHIEETLILKEEIESIINSYQLKYNSNLIEDLKDIASDYGLIKQILSPFIRNKIVESEPPFEIIK